MVFGACIMTDDPRTLAPDALARAAAEAMWEGDRLSQSLGMEITEIGRGRATLAMPVRDDMVNGHGTCHGGMMFALADSAFAFACNSRNAVTVAQDCTIAFLAPAHAGDTLRAEARERSRSGRSGVYDVTVTKSDGRVVAEFRGLSRTVRGHHRPDLATAETEPRED